MTIAADGAARERIRTALGETLVVEAAAGTGKTTVLVERMVATLAEGHATIDRLVAVTFTRKAAGELKLRLRQALDTALRVARRDADGTDGATTRRDRLADAVARLEEAHIGTIHSFCAELLRRRPVEAGVDPAFVEMDGGEADRLYDRAFRGWIERRLGTLPPGLSRALRRLANQRSFDGATPVDRLRQAGRDLVEWRDFRAPWQIDDDFDRADACQRLVEDARELDRLRRQAAPRDPLARALAPIEALVTWVERSEEVTDHLDLDELEALLIETAKALRRDRRGRQGRGPMLAPGVPRREVVDRRDELLDALEDFDRRAGAELAAILRDELAEVLDDYEAKKRAAGRLDFLDLLLCSRDLLRHDAAVAAELRDAFDRLFVDEFQDTDPLQAEVLLRLAADGDVPADDWLAARPAPGKLFLVGDPQQSIYRFRRADGVLYRAIRDRLDAAGAGIVRLGRSFRSIEPIQAALNTTFARRMVADERTGQPDYVPLLGDRPGPITQPSLVALPAPAPYGYSYPSAKSVDRSLPSAVAAWVDWLVHTSGWTVRDPESGEAVAAAPRHVCLLFRRFLSWGRDVTEPYRRAFEARGLPHLLVGGRSFHEREEVETVRAALTAIEWPDDTLAVYATLRGALFAFTDDVLFHFQRTVGHLDPFRPIPEPDADAPASRTEIAEALAFLAELHRARNTVPIATTLHRLLEHVRAAAGFAFRPAGDPVLGNVQRIAELARAFELGGGLSFRGFVDRLDEVAADPSTGHGPVGEEGADGIRLMTVHAAKGLEFPIVILVDPTCKATTREPGLHLDAARDLCARKLLGCSPWELITHRELELERDRAESTRLAYVAATRARDVLVVTGTGIGPWEESWLGALDDAIYPAKEHFHTAASAPGCPDFGGSTVLVGPVDAHRARPTIRPGLHRSRVGDHSVVWWDPSTLRLDVAGQGGVRDAQLLAPDDEGTAVEDGLDRYLDWRADRDDAVADGARPSREVVAVTETERRPPSMADASIEVEIETLPRPTGRPSGRRFGTLVHTLLRDAPLVGAASDDREITSTVDGLARLHGRLLSATDDEIDAASAAVAATLEHPLLRRASELAAEDPDAVLREWPFALELDGGFRLEGVFDLAILDGETWTVIDFKTDADLDRVADTYRRQVAWYAHALSVLDGRPARAVLLGV
ncbi:MAG: UvrD-helicase domain-containing protein [Acidobacteriota bacterium]